MKALIFMFLMIPVLGQSQNWRTIDMDELTGIDVIWVQSMEYNPYDSSMWFVSRFGSIIQMRYDGSHELYNLYDLTGWDASNGLRTINFIDDEVYLLDSAYGFLKLSDGEITVVDESIIRGFELIKNGSDTLIICTGSDDHQAYHMYKDGVFTDSSTINSSIPHNQVGQVLIDDSGRTWMLGYDWVNDLGGGTYMFNGTEWVLYQAWNSNLTHDIVPELFQIPDGDLIAATYGGLAVFDEGTLDWVIYDISNTNLPSHKMKAIEMDSEGRIWVTLSGLGIAYTTNYTDWTIFDETNSPLSTAGRMFRIDEFDNVWMGGSTAHILNLNDFEGWLSVNEQVLNEVKIYPNPATDYIQIESPNPIDKVEVFDLVGNLILTEENIYGDLKLNIESFNRGVYLVKIYSMNEQFTEKVIKK